MPVIVELADVLVFKVTHADPDKPREVAMTVPVENLAKVPDKPHFLIWCAEQALHTRWPVNEETGNWEGMIFVEDNNGAIKLVRYTPTTASGKPLASVTITRME